MGGGLAAVVLGLTAATAYGAADFLGGFVARRTGALRTVLLTQLIGVLALAAALPLVAGSPDVRGVVWGAAAGFAAGAALLAFYRGLAVGRMGLVAPTAAVVSAAVPAVAGLALGERFTLVAGSGVVLALVAVALVCVGPSDATAPTPPHAVGVAAGSRLAVPTLVPIPGLIDAVVAGAGFGCFFIFISQAGGGGVLWPLATTSAVSVLLVGAVLVFRGRSVRPAPGRWPALVGSGVLGTLGSLAFVSATRAGLLSLVAVLASLSPAATVALARFVLAERLLGTQLVGLVLAIAAVALITAG